MLPATRYGIVSIFSIGPLSPLRMIFRRSVCAATSRHTLKLRIGKSRGHVVNTRKAKQWGLLWGLACSLLSLLWGRSCLACINMHATDLQGGHVVAGMGEERYIMGLRRERPTVEFYREAELRAQQRMAEQPTLENRSDHAAVLIFLGEYDRAVELLLALEAEFPGDYSVAANLGTAYELQGNNAGALEWIQTAIDRNPVSHAGSEWVHVEILRAKIRMAETAASEAHVLDLDFGLNPVPAAPSSDSLTQYEIASLGDLCDDVAYQLSERMKFVDAPDPVVADLLFTLANGIAVSQSIEEALPVYELAGEFGYPQHPLLEARIVKLREIVANNPLSGMRDGALSGTAVASLIAIFGMVFVGIPIGLVVLGYYLLKRSHRLRHSQELATVSDIEDAES